MKPTDKSPDEPAASNRGKRAQAHVGEDKGSGAGAGGGGGPEDYDADSVGGNDQIQLSEEPPAGIGADAPSSGSR